MKKVVLAALLLVVAVGSWAFYPKAPADSAYMLLSLEVPYDGRPSLVTTMPNEEETSQRLDLKAKPTRSAQAQLLGKLNELRSQGWTVVQMTSSEDYVQNINFPLIAPAKASKETYLLEKR